MSPGLSGSLEDQVAELRARVHRLEEVLRARGIILEQAETPAAEQTIAAQPPPVLPPVPGPQHAASKPPIAAATPSAQPVFSSFAPSTPADNRSLESRIGSQWFNRIGILAVLIGMAWFLKLAIDNHWIGPLGRVLIGLIAGAALVAWSERFRSHGFAAFSYSLKAAGSGILYLSLWAAFSFFHLVPAGAAFAAMILVTAFNGYMAWVQDAELLALYAIIGGYSTPILVSTGENHEVTLFSYVLLLDIAVLVLVLLRPWSRLLFAAFTGTVLLVAGWWFEYYSNAQSGRTAFFLLCFFLIFAFAPRLVRVKLEDQAHFSGWDTLALVLLPVANAALGFIGFYAIIRSGGRRLGRTLAGSWFRCFLPAAASPAGAGSVAREPHCALGVASHGGRRVSHHRHSSQGPGSMAHHRLAGRRRGPALGGEPHPFGAAARPGPDLPCARPGGVAHGQPVCFNHAVLQPALRDLSVRHCRFRLCCLAGQEREG